MRTLFTRILTSIAVAGGLCASIGAAPAVTPLAIGSAAPDFKLPGVDGKTHSLADYKDAKVLVIVFTCNHCPTAQAYEDRFIKLHKDYQTKGVTLVAINPNDPAAVRLDELGYTDLNDSLDEMKIRARDKVFPFPYLDDGGQTQETARAYGALATPHVFIFDGERKLRYQGRFDDGKNDVREAKTHDARNAIDALLANKAPPVETTKVFGCSTKWADKRDAAKQSIEKWNKEDVTLLPIDLDGVRTLAANAGKDAPLRLVNIWSTWCGPCVEELPEFVTIHRMFRKRPFELITIHADRSESDKAVLKVLKENHVSGINHIFSGDDHDALVAALDPKDWYGPIPHTILIAPGGKVLYRATGAIDPLALKRAIADHLGRTTGSK
jgi:thiol-disulfide isomerase/thioredoxin